MKNLFYSCIAVLLLIVNTHATVHTVNASGTSFSPNNISNVTVGDTIHWVRLNGTHTTTSTTIPVGASAWDNPLNGTTTSFDYTVTVAGTYNYQCTPHASFGMTGSFTATGAAVNPCDTLDCNDSNACTVDDCDSVSGCINTAIVCNDGDSCTTDACVSGVCEFTPIVGCNVGMREFSNSINLSIYPNPANDVFTVEAMQGTLTQIFITDLTGKQVYDSGKINVQQNTIQTASFPSGVYLLHVQSDAGQAVRKILVE